MSFLITYLAGAILTLCWAVYKNKQHAIDTNFRDNLTLAALWFLFVPFYLYATFIMKE